MTQLRLLALVKIKSYISIVNTEVRKTILDLSLIRVAIWGMLASAALPFLKL
ncbi:MAG: hypothetical protein ABR543_07780 [Gemmatimonadaceae bacterium]